MNEILLGYTAGIFDGEGSISLSHNKRYNRISLRARVTSTDEWLCYWLKLNFGGSVGIETTLRNKPCYKWSIGSKMAAEFLALILPYLHIKKPQAELALEFQSRKKYRGFYGSCKMPPEERIFEEAQRILLHKLNDTNAPINYQ